MYSENIDNFAEAGAHKALALRERPIPFLAGAAMAGAYIGFGDIVMFSTGAHVGAAYVHMVMGGVFACALTFVLFAGSDLFTGTAMYMPFALLRGKAGIGEMVSVWAASWIGNLLGAVVLALLLIMAGGGVLLTDGSATFFKVVEAKMAASGPELFARGLLCNWLVCLAIWMCGRTTSDGAKLGLIFWSVFVFIASGFEHSVANMFAFAVALLGPHPATISLSGALHNELWVTLGNLVGGAVFMALGYWVQGDSVGHPSHSRIGGAVTNPRTRP
ncbi:MAG: nitrite transporter NirC [Caulobacteraceae bacterium]|nr:nitrite transporter NirC [Caulobacteraceae bacterium]